MLHTSLFICPVCGLPLIQGDKILKCDRGHSFDIAREGYVNLLLKKQPGDTKEMLMARRHFLERNYYRPLSTAIHDLVSTYLSSRPAHILDAGCGEGYYLSQLQAAIPSNTYTGLDISKEAVKMAARKYPEACFIVANLKERLPFADQALHTVLNIFAPRNIAEFARVLLPAGLLLVVIPGPTHLQQLRSLLHLLNIEENKEQHVIQQHAGLFTLIEARAVSYMLPLTREEVEMAVTMTPNYWHISEETRQAIALIAAISTEISFNCLLFRKSI